MFDIYDKILIAMNNLQNMSQMLEAYDYPAILVTVDYEIIASNMLYREQFGEIDLDNKPNCFKVSHNYSKPCDQEGEHCPLLAAKISKRKEKVLHIHQTKHGKEHVDVEMIPIHDEQGDLRFFVEILKPVPLASGKKNRQKIVGSSPAFEKMLSVVSQVSQSDASVLLLGESGTGKELISQSIHAASPRNNKPLVILECAGLSESLIESELFGHKKGAFTGANADKIGLAEQADGGTLFLDEIGDVSLATQVKLLRLIESKTFRRVGSTEVRTSDFRLICATHKNVASMVEDGSFRCDLYYRINVFPIYIPSLKERKEDIPELVKHFLLIDKTHLNITDSALDTLRALPLNGNIRELKNLINRAIILCKTDTIDTVTIQQCIDIDMPSKQASDNNTLNGQFFTLKQLEQQYLADLMKAHHNDKSRVAKKAGISLRTLYRKLDQPQHIE